MIKLKSKIVSRRRRVIRVRKKISGTAQSPRMCVSKTNRHIHAQIIDDVSGKTLYGSSTMSKDFMEKNSGNIGACSIKDAKILGGLFGEFLTTSNIEAIKFDKRWAKYHGIVAAFADQVREIKAIF
ncbi:MAG: 50S ribosomal protein L18 [Chlamydiia bacterium]|nr:50S ribosomal protein L18 [Chlamydiia bacterium]